MAEAKTSTKVTAPLIPIAASSWVEIPIKGQIPKNLVSTKLLTKTAEIKMISSEVSMRSHSRGALGILQDFRTWYSTLYI